MEIKSPEVGEKSFFAEERR